MNSINSSRVHCVACFRDGDSAEELRRSCGFCATSRRPATAYAPAVVRPVCVAAPKPNFKFRHGKWHVYRYHFKGLVGSGSTPAAAWDHLRLMERIAPPSLLKT